MKHSHHIKFVMGLVLLAGLLLTSIAYSTSPAPIIVAPAGALDPTFGEDINGDGAKEGYLISDATTGLNAFGLILRADDLVMAGGIQRAIDNSYPLGWQGRVTLSGEWVESFQWDRPLLYDLGDISGDTLSFTRVALDALGQTIFVGSLKPKLGNRASVVLSADEIGDKIKFNVFDDLPTSNSANDLLLLSDGSIFLVGSLKNSINTSEGLLLKYDAALNFEMSVNHLLDSHETEFMRGEVLSSTDGTAEEKLVIVGNTKLLGTLKDVYLSLWDSNASLIDEKATDHFGGDDEALAVATDSNQNIFVAGYATDADGDVDAFVSQYSPLGDLVKTTYIDSGFGEDKGYSIALDSQGRIVVAGRLAQEKTDAFFVSRLNTDLEFDTEFGTNGITTLDVVAEEASVKNQTLFDIKIGDKDAIFAVGSIRDSSVQALQVAGEQVVVAKFLGEPIEETPSCAGCGEPDVPEPYCGDGNVDSGEECDDGNFISGDGCSNVCSVEFDNDGDGYFGELDCDDNDANKNEPEDCTAGNENPNSSGGCGCMLNAAYNPSFEILFYSLGLVLWFFRQKNSRI